MLLLGNASANTEFGKTLARDGLNSASGNLSGLSAKDELGVDASGSQGNGGREVDVQFSQLLSSEIECPVAAAETGKYQKVQQFVAVCEGATSVQTKLWVCLPNDTSDVMNENCDDGTWTQGLVTRNATSWKKLTTGLDVRLTDCDSSRCELEIKKGGEFKGGEGVADAKGQNALANANGAAGDVKGMGAYLPDGTPLQGGTNPNTGDYLGEMVAAGTIAECADDVKASIKNGTPVFTCNGQTEVDTLTGGEDECKDVETCQEWETETITSMKRCQVSVNYDSAQCTTDTPWKECTLSNVREEYTCDVDTAVDVKSIYSYEKVEAVCVSKTLRFDNWRTGFSSSNPYPNQTGDDWVAFYHQAYLRFGLDAWLWINGSKKKWCNPQPGATGEHDCAVENGTSDPYSLRNSANTGRNGGPPFWGYGTRIGYLGKTRVSGSWMFPHYNFWRNGTVVEVCNKPMRSAPCKSGYSETGGRCVKSGTSTWGYNYYTRKFRSNPPADEPNSRWDYYVKQSEVNGCTLYEGAQ